MPTVALSMRAATRRQQFAAPPARRPAGLTTPLPAIRFLHAHFCSAMALSGGEQQQQEEEGPPPFELPTPRYGEGEVPQPKGPPEPPNPLPPDLPPNHPVEVRALACWRMRGWKALLSAMYGMLFTYAAAARALNNKASRSSANTSLVIPTQPPTGPDPEVPDPRRADPGANPPPRPPEVCAAQHISHREGGDGTCSTLY